MACGNLQSVQFDLCTASKGGLRKCWMIDAENVTSITTGAVSGVTGDMVTNVTLSGGTFTEFTLKKNLSSFSAEAQVSDNGVYVLTTLNLVFPRMDAAKHAAASSLLLAEAVALVLDANGKYWLIGSNLNPLTIESATGESGAGRDDANAYTVGISCESDTYPYEVDPSIVAQLIGE